MTFRHRRPKRRPLGIVNGDAKATMDKVDSPRVLVVEDDPLFLWVLKYFLEKQGYDVQGVSTAESAGELVSQQDFEVLIVGHHLPGLNGRNLVQKINKIHPRTKTIMISSYEPQELSGGQKMKVNLFLNKPLKLESLRSALEKTLETKPPETQQGHSPG